MFKNQARFFGGALLDGKRKSIRPLSSKDSIHFVLRSEWAVGKDSFLIPHHRKMIERIIQRFAKKFGVRIYRQAINSNHIHLLLRITNRVLYRAFIKAVSGKIASLIMHGQSFKSFKKSSSLLFAGDGVTNQRQQRFWEFRPFSRIVSWGRDFKNCVNYLKQNTLDALGFVPYTARKNYYAKWLSSTLPKLI